MIFDAVAFCLTVHNSFSAKLLIWINLCLSLAVNLQTG